jgi:hydroxymethylpyrimidine/phosphomethylpyrimidine kinase
MVHFQFAAIAIRGRGFERSGEQGFEYIMKDLYPSHAHSAYCVAVITVIQCQKTMLFA